MSAVNVQVPSRHPIIRSYRRHRRVLRFSIFPLFLFDFVFCINRSKFFPIEKLSVATMEKIYVDGIGMCYISIGRVDGGW